MSIWTEFSDSYAVELFRDNLHPKSMFEAELAGGIKVCFGEPKSKFKSGRYELTEVVFEKSMWTYMEARDWWGQHTVLAFERDKYGFDRKLMPVEDWFEFDGGHLYIFVCRRGKKGQHSARDYIKGRVKSVSADSLQLICPGCGKPHNQATIDQDFYALCLQTERQLKSPYLGQKERLMQDILSIPGQKIVTVTLFCSSGFVSQAFDINPEGRIGYSDEHICLFHEAVLLAFENDAGLIIRQFLDFGVNETHEGRADIYIPRKNIYAIVVRGGQYHFLPAEQVDLACNTDSVTGEMLEPEKYVFYRGFPDEDIGADSPWDELEF